MPTLEEDQDTILALLKTKIPTVFEGALPDGFKLPTEGAYFLPYAIVMFGGLSPVAVRNQTITSSRDDLKWTAVSLEIVGHTPRTARYAAGKIRDALEGYSPSESWGELTEVLSTGYGIKVPDHDIWPLRYQIDMVFNTMTNAVRPD